MESTPRWGITLPLRSMPLPDQRDLVAALPDLGYTDAWSSEVNGADAFTPLAAAALWTTGLRFGTAIAGIYTRGPALLAMNAATCASLAPGRFVLGIGTSSPVIVEDWNGLKLDRPYQRARDTLRFLRAALAGEKVSGEFDAFASIRPPRSHRGSPWPTCGRAWCGSPPPSRTGRSPTGSPPRTCRRCARWPGRTAS